MRPLRSHCKGKQNIGLIKKRIPKKFEYLIFSASELKITHRGLQRNISPRKTWCPQGEKFTFKDIDGGLLDRQSEEPSRPTPQQNSYSLFIYVKYTDLTFWKLTSGETLFLKNLLNLGQYSLSATTCSLSTCVYYPTSPPDALIWVGIVNKEGALSLSFQARGQSLTLGVTNSWHLLPPLRPYLSSSPCCRKSILCGWG